MVWSSGPATNALRGPTHLERGGSVTVGSTLASGRQAAGLSLEDISAVTRLRPSLLAAMEADDFTLCGAETYARGHVRSFAQAVGIDPDAAVAEFDADRSVNRPPAPSMRKDFENGRRSIDDAPRAPNWNGVARIALILLFIVLVIALILRARGH